VEQLSLFQTISYTMFSHGQSKRRGGNWNTMTTNEPWLITIIIGSCNSGGDQILVFNEADFGKTLSMSINTKNIDYITEFWMCLLLFQDTQFCCLAPLEVNQNWLTFYVFFSIEKKIKKKNTVNLLIQIIEYPWLSIYNSNMPHLLFLLKVNYGIFFLKHSFDLNTRYCVVYCLPNLG